MVGDVMQRYQHDQIRRGLQPTTVTQSRRVLIRLALWLEPRALIDAAAADIEAFLDSVPGRSQSRIPSTRAWYLTVIHSFYRWAAENELLETAPTASIRRPKKPKRYPRPISTADLDVALSVAPPRERAMLALAAFAGLRCIEISRLTREDILDHQEPPVLLALGKGQKERIVPLHPEVWRALGLLPVPKSGRVFRHADGRAMTAQRVSQIGNGYLASVGTDATMHQLRHFFGTHLYRTSGHDLLLVAALMGHENPATTTIYARYDRAGARAAVEALTVNQPAVPTVPPC